MDAEISRCDGRCIDEFDEMKYIRVRCRSHVCTLTNGRDECSPIQMRIWVRDIRRLHIHVMGEYIYYDPTKHAFILSSPTAFVDLRSQIAKKMLYSEMTLRNGKEKRVLQTPTLNELGVDVARHIVSFVVKPDTVMLRSILDDQLRCVQLHTLCEAVDAARASR